MTRVTPPASPAIRQVPLAGKLLALSIKLLAER